MNKLSKLAATAVMAFGLNLPAHAVDVPYLWNQTLQGSSDPSATDTLCGTYSLPTIKTGMLALNIELDANAGDLTAIVHKTSSSGAVVGTITSSSKRPVAITSLTPLFVELKCNNGQTSYSPGVFRAYWSGAWKNLFVNAQPGAFVQVYDSAQGSLVAQMDANATSGLAKFTLQPGSYLVRSTYNGAQAWAGSNGLLKPRENASAISMSTSDKVVSLQLADPPTIDSASIDPTTRKLLIQGTGFGDDPGYVEVFTAGKISRSAPSNTTVLNWTDGAIYATPGTLSVDRCARVFSSIGGWSKACIKY